MDEINNHKEFVNAIHSKSKVYVTFFSKEDDRVIERMCAPMDYGPSKRRGQIIDGGKNKYQLWDYDSDTKQHVLPLKSQNIRSLDVVSEKFNPRNDFDFDIDTVEWFIPRNW